MECNQSKSVVGLVDSLERSAHARRSRVLLHNPSAHAPVSSKSLTDFSVCSILGLENDVTQSSPGSEYHSATSPPLSPYSNCTSPRPSHRETSPLSTAYSDITSSSSDCDSDPDKVPIYSDQPPREKRQRTTFSLNKVLELEEAFRRRPYLTAYDYEELGQRLGITIKSVKVWFQNRRSRWRRRELKNKRQRTQDATPAIPPAPVFPPFPRRPDSTVTSWSFPAPFSPSAETSLALRCKTRDHETCSVIGHLDASYGSVMATGFPSPLSMLCSRLPQVTSLPSSCRSNHHSLEEYVAAAT